MWLEHRFYTFSHLKTLFIIFHQSGNRIAEFPSMTYKLTKITKQAKFRQRSSL